MEKEKRRIWQALPCEDYDIAALEAWLTDMAHAGWYLTRDGFFLNFACFEEGPTGPIAYRLEGALHKASLFSDRGENPDEEAVDLAAQYGWNYVARVGQFFVYASYEEDPVEFNTDPQVQAIALQAVKSRLLSDAVSTFLWLGLYTFFSVKGMVLQLMVETSSLFVLIAIALILYHITRGVIRVVFLHRLRKKLLSEGILEADSSYKERKMGRWIRESIVLAATVFWLIWVLNIWGRSITEEDYHKILDESVDPPFATLHDMVPGEYDTMFSGMGDCYRTWSDPVAPICWDWEEAAEIRTPSGEVFSGNLYVSYYETRWDFFAMALARSYLWSGRWERDFETHPVNLDGMDFAAAYSTRYMGGRCLILCKDNRILTARLFTGDDLPFEEWTQMLAESIRS